MELKLKFTKDITIHHEGAYFYVFHKGDVLMGSDQEEYWRTKFGKIPSEYLELDFSDSTLTKPEMRDDLEIVTLKELYEELAQEKDFFWLMHGDSYIKVNTRVFKSPLFTVMPDIESAINKTHLANFIAKYEEEPILLEIIDGTYIPVLEVVIDVFKEEEGKKLVKLFSVYNA